MARAAGQRTATVWVGAAVVPQAVRVDGRGPADQVGAAVVEGAVVDVGGRAPLAVLPAMIELVTVTEPTSPAADVGRGCR